jgi:DNA-dependent protein kinase catalytic subunit
LADSDETDAPAGAGPRLRVGKRFVQRTDFDRTKAYFARAAARSEERSASRRKDEAGRRAAGVTLMRRYRLGDLPDVEITYEDVVKSVRNLCVKDELSARTFLRMVFESLAASATRRDEEDGIAAIREGLDSALKTDGIQNGEVCASLLELGILFPDAVSIERVNVLSKHFHLESLGILQLEKLVSGEDGGGAEQPPSKKKRKRQDDKDSSDPRSTWTSMMELYRSAGDYDSARGIAFQALESSAGLQEALRAESEEDWMRAKMKYLKEAESSGKEAEVWHEALLHSMEKLSEWEELSERVDKLRGTSPSFLWDSEKARRALLPRFMCANLHRLVEDGSKPNDIFSQAELCRSNEQNFDHMKRNHGIELALLYVHQDKLGEARLCAEVLKENHLAEQASASELSERNLFGLFRFGQLLHFLEALDDRAAGKRTTNNSFDPPLERNAFVLRASDLQSGDAILCDRAFYFRGLVAHGAADASPAARARFNGYLALCAESVSRRQFHVAVRMLKQAKPLLPKRPADPGLEAAFQTHYADAMVLRCLRDSSASLEQRFNALYRSYVDAEDEKKGDAPRVAKLLEALQELAREFGDDSEVSEIASILSTGDKQSHFAELAQNVSTVKDLRGKLLATAVARFNSLRSVPAEHSLELASICYRLWSDFGARDDATLSTLFSSHVAAVNEGIRASVDLFPRLLEVLRAESTVTPQQQHFRQAMAQVKEPWRLLPWKNQLLSYLGGPLGRFVQPLILSLAKQFPQALVFPYALSKETQNFGNTAGLDELLAWSPLTTKLVRSLGNVCLPLVKVHDLVESIVTSDKSACSRENLQRVQEVRKQLVEKSDLFGNLHWSCKPALAHLDRLFAILKKERNPNGRKEISELLRQVKADVRADKSSPALEDYSVFLSSFHPGAFEESVEIPGQYDGAQMPNPSGHVRLSCFERDVAVFSSIRKPIKVTMVGDDGRRYPFIVKCGEDLRQDERVEQVFGVANRLLRGELSVHTYAVLPLETTLGLIECVENTVTYKSLVADGGGRNHAGVQNLDEFRRVLRLPPEKRKRAFLETVAKSDSNALRRGLLARSHSPQGFFFLRDNFSRSHGVHSAVGWLLSLGDRHADNLLVSTVTGRSIPIDFGYSFGATAFLAIPELPPFRLTPNIQNLMLPFKNQGCLRESMIRALGCMVASKSVVRTLLDVYITEPTLDWLKLAKRSSSAGEPGRQHQRDGGSAFAKNKMAIVEKKLACCHPVDVVLEELRQGVERPEDMLKQIESVLLGDDECVRRALRASGRTELSVGEVVDCLLEAATDPGVLATPFQGWNPHL